MKKSLKDKYLKKLKPYRENENGQRIEHEINGVMRYISGHAEMNGRLMIYVYPTASSTEIGITEPISIEIEELFTILNVDPD